jgi:hypothetical protein
MSPWYDHSSLFLRKRAEYLKLVKMATDECVQPSLRQEMISFTDNLKRLFIRRSLAMVKYVDDDLHKS